MKIINDKIDGTQFHYLKKPEKKIIGITKYCFQNDYIKNNSFELIKKGNQREIYKFKVNSKSYYLKKYSYRNLGKRIKNFFRASAAYRSFKITIELLEKNISVVKPILAAEYQYSPFITDSIFITKDFGGVNLQKFLAYNDYSQLEKEKVIIKVAKLWSKLYRNNYINGDPNLPGVLLRYNDKLELALVDLDNFQKKIYLSQEKVIKNLAKFNAHGYSGLEKLQGKKLKKEDRKLFLKYFLKFYNRINLDINNLLLKTEKETAKYLNKWNKDHLF